jgi:hypothetical protein
MGEFCSCQVGKQEPHFFLQVFRLQCVAALRDVSDGHSRASSQSIHRSILAPIHFIHQNFKLKWRRQRRRHHSLPQFATATFVRRRARLSLPGRGRVEKEKGVASRRSLAAISAI